MNSQKEGIQFPGRLAPAVFTALVFWFLSGSESFGQNISIEYNQTATELAESIAGNGVQLINPVLVCADSAAGKYNAQSVTGFPDGPGIVLSTGNIQDLRGPNQSQSTTTEFDTPGDSLLTFIAGNSTFDACALEFDVVPIGDTLRFNFTFASEEYSEYVGTPFNDAFGFFISGPGITGDPGLNGQENIALIPGTSDPVEINSVNNGNPDIGFPAVNPQFFVDNPLGFNSAVEYDGWTQNIFAEKIVTPCDTFHLKLVIADVADREYDHLHTPTGNPGSVSCNLLYWRHSHQRC
ncbi:MAG: choice-of-anchor L domain-containing protein [Flavobacteriales bacterium]|nr:choice-of-anchor L domain-containing protein [Flavobacteriales bacterium]